jgi:type III secretory pathway lipoprotein EscJ
VRAALVLLALAACAPTIDGPIERQRALDRDDSARLAKQLAQLPGAVRAEVTLHRPAIEPLSDAAVPGSAAVLVVVDDAADRRAIQRSAIALVRGTAPEIAEPAIVVELGAVRPVIAHVGPLAVEAHSKRRVVALLAGMLAAIALLSGYIAWRERVRILRHRTPLWPDVG